jgi:hypothetical protein
MHVLQGLVMSCHQLELPNTEQIDMAWSCTFRTQQDGKWADKEQIFLNTDFNRPVRQVFQAYQAVQAF